MRERRALTCLLASVGLVAGLLGGCTSDDTGEPGALVSRRAAAPPPTPVERLGLVPGWGPTPAELEEAAGFVEDLGVRDLAGQVIVARWHGTRAPTGLVRRLHLGGVIAFSDNVTSTNQIRQVNAALRRAGDRPWPLFLAVDQEGGAVERVKGTATRFPAFMSAGAARDEALTQAAYAASGAELRGLGFNVDLGPDADVTVGRADPTIGARSAGSDPALVAAQTAAAARGFVAGGIVPVLKHFPGHGSVLADSHRTLPVQERSMAKLRSTDLVPFADAVRSGTSAIMVGHLDVRAVDPRVPSSLSHQVVDGLLRDELGFDGLAVTDALDMAGVRAGRSPAEIAVRALRAGNDVLLMPSDPAAARAGIVRAVREERLPLDRLKQAAARQIALLLHHRATAARGAKPGSGATASRALSAAAVTSVAGPCGGPLLAGAVVPVGSPVAVANFRTAARQAGLALGRITYEKPPKPPKRKKKKLRRWRRLEPTPVYHGTPMAFTGYRGAASSAPIVIATDAPYVLGQVSAGVRIATYGETPGAMSALVDVLLGKAPATGRLPVVVPGAPRRGCQ
ncbi:glycoside hydrolase family 3 protein [Nocardioides sp. LHG3406-4]|uniref:glycoside hydrolase family 3 protein n=1 Tax=Nocardioides sp. LHG3406-4 TaxID=2804575 RepID=UPI003CF6965C